MKIKITFDKLYVTDNGDPSHETNGELYYSFKVNGKSLISRSKSNPKKVKDKATIQLNKCKELDVKDNETIKVSGYVGDSDKGFNGKDEYDDFSVILKNSNNWKEGSNSVHLVDGRLNVTLYYEVEIEGSTNTTGLNTPKKSASLTLVSFDDSKFYNLVQNAHNNYSLGFEGYDKSVLMKKVYTSFPKPSEHVKDTTKKKFLEKLTELADNGYFIDVIIHSHGTYEKVTLDDGEVITNNDIQSLATGKYAGGKFPLRMVYMVNCNGSTLNNNFINAGAKAVCGAKFINFMPNQANKFIREWNDGERFDTAIRNSDTASSRTVMHSLIVADSKTTKFEPKCKIFSTVLGKSDCAEAYFTKFWLAKKEYDSNKSGKDNMNASSKMIISGDAGLRKADRPSW
ncbi:MULTISPECIES: hypothetical protein [Aquimarina]|uniref:CHAT domain-containing protein n=1 Tax=Aquimarina rubra TaxID=1920033 RepID=A0ABW5LH81_9FLAO